MSVLGSGKHLAKKLPAIKPVPHVSPMANHTAMHAAPNPQASSDAHWAARAADARAKKAAPMPTYSPGKDSLLHRRPRGHEDY